MIDGDTGAGWTTGFSLSAHSSSCTAHSAIKSLLAMHRYVHLFAPSCSLMCYVHRTITLSIRFLDHCLQYAHYLPALDTL